MNTHDWIEVGDLPPLSSWAGVKGPWARVRLRCSKCRITAVLYVRSREERGVILHDRKYRRIKFDRCSA